MLVAVWPSPFPSVIFLLTGEFNSYSSAFFLFFPWTMRFIVLLPLEVTRLSTGWLLLVALLSMSVFHMDRTKRPALYSSSLILNASSWRLKNYLLWVQCLELSWEGFKSQNNTLLTGWIPWGMAHKLKFFAMIFHFICWRCLKLPFLVPGLRCCFLMSVTLSLLGICYLAWASMCI